MVTLKGLGQENFGGTTGVRSGGIVFEGAGVLNVYRGKINRFGGGYSGIRFVPTGPAELYVTDTFIAGNGASSGDAGILLQPANGSSRSTIVIHNSRIENNLHGIIADANGTTGGMLLTVSDTTVVGNSGNGITTLTNNGGVNTMLKNLTVSNNGGIGISTNGANTTTRLGNSLITGNGTGVAANGGATFLSYGNNQINGNVFDGPALPLVSLR